ncbi:MAG: hypothetical protein AAF664_25155 [Planctomycetota bacterium]
MASNFKTYLTDRDYEVLDALVKTPLDARQLLSMSRCFARPFTHERLVRRRMTQLVTSGFLKCYQYATRGAGALNYYKPTKQGYQIMQGSKCQLPPRSYFAAVSMSMQEHTRSLSDFIVKTHVAASEQGIRLNGFYRENGLQLTLGKRSLQPDCAFQLLDDSNQAYNYLVEIDCGSEPVRSTKHRESLEQKIRFYDEYQDKTRKRFRVLVLFSKPSVRMTHFCEMAHELVRNPRRHLFYAGLLSSYLQNCDAIRSPIFVDRHLNTQALVPCSPARPGGRSPSSNRRDLLVSAASVW